MLGANDDRYMCMMKDIITDTSYKGASYGTHSTASHDDKINATFLNYRANSLTRFTTTELNLKSNLKKVKNK